LVDTEPVLNLRHRHGNAAANTRREFAWSNPHASHPLLDMGLTIKLKLTQVIGRLLQSSSGVILARRQAS
jgi:hypothetical protein